MTTSTTPQLPTDRLGAVQIAEILGIKRNTWNTMKKNGATPEPDGHEAISGWPWWYRSTIEAWLPTRPGRGFRRDLGQNGCKPEGRTARARKAATTRA